MKQALRELLTAYDRDAGKLTSLYERIEGTDKFYVIRPHALLRALERR